MFGSRVHPPRPILLLLVFGAFLAIIGITAAAQSVLVGAHFSTSTLNAIVGSDAATTRAFVNAYVQPLMSNYLERLDLWLQKAGFCGYFCLMTSSGGLCSVDGT